MLPKMGRPPKPKDEVRSVGIHIRVTPSEKEDIMAYCNATGVTCREFLHLGIETHKQKRVEADKEK